MATQLNPIKITGKADNALQGIHFDGDIVHRWSLKRVDGADILTYKTLCVRFSDTQGEVVCRDNHDGVCRHEKEALKEAMRLAGFRLVEGGNQVRLGNGFRSVTFSVQRIDSNSLANLQELIDSKRLALEPGKTMPIGYKVQLRRMERDGRDVLVFENGARRSATVARLGRDYQSRNVRHQWKMTADAERNYREFCG